MAKRFSQDTKKADLARRAAEDRKYYVKIGNLDDFGSILRVALSEGSDEIFLEARCAIGSAPLEPQGQIVR